MEFDFLFKNKQIAKGTKYEVNTLVLKILTSSKFKPCSRKFEVLGNKLGIDMVGTLWTSSK